MINMQIRNNFGFVLAERTNSQNWSSIRLYVKSQDPFKMSFKLKFESNLSFVSVPAPFKKEINAFDSFGIE